MSEETYIEPTEEETEYWANKYQLKEFIRTILMKSFKQGIYAGIDSPNMINAELLAVFDKVIEPKINEIVDKIKELESE